MLVRKSVLHLNNQIVKKGNSKVGGKVCIRAKWPIRPELIPVSVA